MATKKTAKKSGDVGVALVAQAKIAKAAVANATKYATIGDVMRAKAKGAIPRGAKFEIRSDRAVLVAGATTLLNVSAGEVARWGLRKLGFKADHAA